MCLLVVALFYVLPASLAQISGNIYILMTDSWARQIWSVDLTSFNYTYVVIKKHGNPMALVYDPVENKIYWTDTDRSDIRSCGFHGEDLNLVKQLSSGAIPEGLAIDPVSRLLFYTDMGKDVIALIEMRTFYQKTIIKNGLDEPRGIALDRIHGWIYWADRGEKPKIEKSTYLGENRTVLVSSSLVWPSGITLDVQAQKMYWCDSKLGTVEEIGFDGSNRTVLSSGTLQNPFGIYLFQEILYLSDWSSNEVYRVYLDGSNTTRIIASKFQHLNGITVFQAGTFHNDTNACTENNNGCEQICIPTAVGRRCECSDGFHLSSDSLSCSPACSGSDGFHCNVHFNNSHIIYENGMVQNDSGGICVAPDNCTDCNKGFYPAAGYCNMCHSINNCDFEECTTGSDETCSHCEGVVNETAGLRAYVITSDKRSCRKACSWRHDSTRCYPGQCDGELADNCKCHPGFTGHHCESILTYPVMHVKLQMTASDGNMFDLDSTSRSTLWINLINVTSVHYNLSAHYAVQSSDTLPPRPAYITNFNTGIVHGKFTFELIRGGHVVFNISRTCMDVDVNNSKTHLDSCVEALTMSDLPPETLQLHNRDRINLLFETSNGGSVTVKNIETDVLETFLYNGQRERKLYSLNVDLQKPYHISTKLPCHYNMLGVNDIIKQANASRIYIKMNGWMDDESGISTITISAIQLHYFSGKLESKSGDLVFQTTVNDSKDQTVEFTLSSPGVYSILLSVVDKAHNKRKARRIIMYDPFSTITVNEDHPIRVTSASASTNYTWQVDTKKITVDFTDRFINKLQTTNYWLAAVADDTDIDTQYDDEEGERTLLEIPNIHGIVKFKTAYVIRGEAVEEKTTEPYDYMFEDQGLKTVVEFTPRLEDGDLIILWVKAFDIKHNVKTENVQVHFDSSPPEIRKITLTEDSSNGNIELKIAAVDTHSGIDQISWQITDKTINTLITSNQETVTPLNVTSCRELISQSEVENCYCTPQRVCYSKDHTLKLISIQEFKSTFNIIVTVWNNAQNSTVMEKQMFPSIQPPTGKIYIQEGTLFSWTTAFERPQEVKFYKYSFEHQCHSVFEISSNSSTIQVTTTKDTEVSWRSPPCDNYYLTVVAFDNTSKPVDARCSDIINISSKGECHGTNSHGK